MNASKTLVAALAVAALAGCASVPMASPELDARAKAFATDPAKAGLYVYRNESLGAAIKMPVTLDGKPVGTTAAKTYLMLMVEPGKHRLLSDAEGDSVLDLDLKAGTNTFVWQEVKMGMLSAGSKLQVVDEARGKADIAACKLIQGR